MADPNKLLEKLVEHQAKVIEAAKETATKPAEPVKPEPRDETGEPTRQAEPPRSE